MRLAQQHANAPVEARQADVSAQRESHRNANMSMSANASTMTSQLTETGTSPGKPRTSRTSSPPKGFRHSAHADRTSRSTSPIKQRSATRTGTSSARVSTSTSPQKRPLVPREATRGQHVPRTSPALALRYHEDTSHAEHSDQQAWRDLRDSSRDALGKDDDSLCDERGSEDRDAAMCDQKWPQFGHTGGWGKSGEVEVLAEKLRLSQHMVQELQESNMELDKALHVALSMSRSAKVLLLTPPVVVLPHTAPMIIAFLPAALHQT